MSAEPRRLFDALAAGWRRRSTLTAALHGAAVALPGTALVWLALEGRVERPWIAAAVLGTAVLLSWAVAAKRSAGVGAEQVARHLDRVLPQLEDSSALALIPPEGLPLLARLQRGRVLAGLGTIDTRNVLPSRALTSALRWATAGLLVGAAIAFGFGDPPRPAAPVDATSGEPASAALSPADAIEIEIQIDAPAYTRLPARSVRGLDVEAAEGARLRWRVTVPGDIDGVALVFDEARRLELEPAGSAEFVGVADADASHIYYLLAYAAGDERYRSGFARLKVIPDAAPDLRVIAPEPRLVLDPTDALRLAVEVEARDDYGLSAAALVATLASGTGEMVQFREQRLGVSLRPGEGGTQPLTAALDLAALGMLPGGELYFHLEVTDNREPEPNRSRTPAWVVRLPGPNAPAIEMSGGLPIVRLPEYFRSQRQIIIDTEKLIAESAAITRAEFERRAQSIGFDQRALRMRYGTLLGEEFESGVPLDQASEDGDHEHEAPAGDEEEDPVEAALEGFVHEHDSEESATFFTTPIKQQLRAALAAMWDAEGDLRTYAPDRALPAEYTALRHIKAVQQSERAYVLKVGFDPPPLDVAALRLTGDLSRIKDQNRSAAPEAKRSAVELKRALDLLDELRDNPARLPADFDPVLAGAARALTERAREHGSGGLETLDALRRVRDALERAVPPDAADLDLVTRDLWAALPPPERRPQARRTSREALYEAYVGRLAEAP